MTRALALLLLSALPSWAANVVPDDRLWDARPGITVGVLGGVPDFSTWTQFTNFVTAGGDATGVTNNSTLLSSLINHASRPANSYIYVPDGLYRFSNALSFAASALGCNWAVVGQSTNAVFFHRTAFINLDNWAVRAPVRILNDITNGTTNLVLASAFDTGDLNKRVKISTSNAKRTNVLVISSGFTDRNYNEWAEPVSLTNGTNLTVWPPLAMLATTNMEPWLQADYSTQLNTNWHFHKITITGTNVFTGEQYDNNNIISIFGGKNWSFSACFFINPRSGFQFNMSQNLFWEIRDNTFIGSEGGGANTSCIIAGGDSSGLIENNFGTGSSPFTQLNNNSRDIVGYNYVTNAVQNDSYVGNPFDQHQPHSHHILYEGNSGVMYQADAYHGSGSECVLYRNEFTGYDPIKSFMPRAVHLGRWHDRFTLVANDLGVTNLSGWYYTVTNQYYSSAWPIVISFGFPFVGNTSYGHVGAAITTLNTDPYWPGTNMLCGTVTQATALTNIIWGNFATLPSGDNGQQVALQPPTPNTNGLYHLDTNSNWLITANDSTSMTLSEARWITNGSLIFVVGPNAWPALDIARTNTHFIEANYNASNNAVVWSGSTNLAGLPDSHYRDSRPAWFTNASGAVMEWPPFGMATEGETARTNRLPAQSLFYDTAAAGAAPNAPRGRGLRGLRLRPWNL